MGTPDGRRYSYEDPAALAWGGRMVRTWLERQNLRLAAEQADDSELASPEEHAETPT